MMYDVGSLLRICTMLVDGIGLYLSTARNMITQEISVVDATRTNKAQKHVEECVAANKCLCCDRKIRSLGLCEHHYTRHRDELAKLGPRAAAKYVAKLIKDGSLLRRDEIHQIKRLGDVFAVAASEV